ncbi:MAG: phosphate signaling complex protein PhoU [Clostridia bacterium]|nr:phosphate signaling complex protein PhoU [Clostridia bacterium]
MRVRARFDDKLQELENQLIKMGANVEDVVSMAFKALLERDTALAKKAIAADGEVDRLEIEIEKDCLNLIALQQPLAGDLREIAGILKIITDLERIGDYGVNIAKIAVEFDEEEFIKPLVDLPEMENIVREMVKGSLDAFVEKDVELARRIAKLDDRVDLLYARVYNDLLEFGMKDSVAKRQIIRLLFVGRHLERMADHVTNICERVIYMIDGIRENY